MADARNRSEPSRNGRHGTLSKKSASRTHTSIRIMLLKVAVIADGSAPRWSTGRVVREIVSNLEYEGFTADVEIVHVEHIKETHDDH